MIPITTPQAFQREDATGAAVLVKLTSVEHVAERNNEKASETNI